MQRFFTKNLILLVLGFVSINLMGQNLNTLTINSPSGIQGDYVAVRAQFGSMSNTPITANAVFVNDGTANATFGCMPATNNITGLVTFIDRGTCQFGEKALAAQNKGALVAIICNNLANQSQAPFPMTPGNVGAQVTIPTFNVSYSDCQKIRADIIAGGVNVTIQNTCKNTATFGPTVVWGALPGQGDFKGGLNGWTVDKENTWEYNVDGNIIKGAYGGVQMISNSACDGVMEFNSDFLDNGGVQGDFGSGLCPQVCTGALISPNITGLTNIEGLFIEFTQAHRQFQSRYFIMVSRDGGATWPDTVQINAELPNNPPSPTPTDRKRVALVGYKNATQVRFKFEYVGNYYYWAIDDVVLINEAKADVKVNENFYAAAPSLVVPASQVADMAFLADVSNVGNGNATNVKLDVVITDPANGNAELLKLTNDYGNLNSAAAQENKPFAETWTPPNVVGTYNGAYVITATEDVSGTNNMGAFSFQVSENTYANLLSEDQVTPANYLGYVLDPWAVGDEVTYYSAGNIYRITNAANLTIDKVRFGLANDIANISETGFINIDVYEWVDEDGGNECSPIERVKVGTNAIFIDGNAIDNSRSIELPIWALDSEGNANVGVEVDLKSNTDYIVIAHTSPLDASVERYELLGYTGRTFSSFDRSTNYAASSFAYDTLKIDRNVGSLFGLTGVSAEDVEDRNFEIVQNGASRSTTYLEMDIRLKSGTYDINDKAEVSTFPNPASRELYIDIALKEVSQNVKVDLISLDGRIAATKSFGNVQDSRLRLDLNNVISGAYTALIHTDGGVISRKVIVQK